MSFCHLWRYTHIIGDNVLSGGMFLCEALSIVMVSKGDSEGVTGRGIFDLKGVLSVTQSEDDSRLISLFEMG